MLTILTTYISQETGRKWGGVERGWGRGKGEGVSEVGVGTVEMDKG